MKTKVAASTKKIHITTFRLDKATHSKLKKLALKKDISMSSLVTRAVKQTVDRAKV